MRDRDESIVLRAIAACALLLILPAGPMPLVGQSGFLEKLEETDVNDPASLLATGVRCERERQPGQAAKFYAMVLKAGVRTGREQWTAASLALARIDIEGGRYEDAYD